MKYCPECGYKFPVENQFCQVEDLMTLQAAFEIYYEDLVDRKISSAKQELSRWNKHIRDYLGRFPLYNIHLQDLNRFKKQLKVRESTKYLILGTISRIYNRLIELEVYHGENPVKLKALKFKNPKQKRKRWLTIAQSEMLMDELAHKPDPAVYKMAAFALYAGLRIGEIHKLTWRNVDYAARKLVAIPTKDKNDPYKTRDIPYGSKLNKIIMQIYPYFSGQPDRLFFPVNFNYKQFYQAVDHLGFNNGVAPGDRINKISFHSLRHSFATHHILNGTDIKTVQYLMGHAELTSTIVYLKASAEEAKKAQEKLDELRHRPHTTYGDISPEAAGNALRSVIKKRPTILYNVGDFSKGKEAKNATPTTL